MRYVARRARREAGAHLEAVDALLEPVLHPRQRGLVEGRLHLLALLVGQAVFDEVHGDGVLRGLHLGRQDVARRLVRGVRRKLPQHVLHVQLRRVDDDARQLAQLVDLLEALERVARRAPADAQHAYFPLRAGRLGKDRASVRGSTEWRGRR
jgi:hypothetical protein